MSEHEHVSPERLFTHEHDGPEHEHPDMVLREIFEAAERERDDARAALANQTVLREAEQERGDDFKAKYEAAEARVRELEEAAQCVLSGTVPAKSPSETNPDGSDSWSAVETWRVDRLRERLLAGQTDDTRGAGHS